MMLQMVFVLRDVKADLFGRPIFVANLGSLVRELQTAVRSGGEDLLCKHPRDFVLYRLGTFDDSKGLFDLLALPDFVLEVSSLIEAPASLP